MNDEQQDEKEDEKFPQKKLFIYLFFDSRVGNVMVFIGIEYKLFMVFV